MHNKSRKTKNSLKEFKNNPPQRTNQTRNSATKTPKQLQTANQHKSPQISKFKSLPTNPHRQMTCSVFPPQIHFSDKQNQLVCKAYKSNKTNASALDLPYSHSQKTLTFHKADQNNKTNNKRNQTSKKQSGRRSKFEHEAKLQAKGILTTRKSSTKRLTLNVLLRKTERVLHSYQKKEQQWAKERQILLQELEELKKKKNYARTLTSSTSSYLNKRHLY